MRGEGGRVRLRIYVLQFVAGGCGGRDVGVGASEGLGGGGWGPVGGIVVV